jgi:hypothetical protein
MLVFSTSSRFAARARRRLAVCSFLGLAAAFSLTAVSGLAEEHKKKPKHRNTPLDTIMQTKLWTDAPEPKDFVKAARPPAERLHYQPVTGTDPERPKPSTPAELKSLEAELETARLKADKRGGIKPSSTVAPSTKTKVPAAPQ